MVDVIQEFGHLKKLDMVLTANDFSLLSWKAGYSDELSARFGGGWAETCPGNWKTRRPSILYKK